MLTGMASKGIDDVSNENTADDANDGGERNGGRRLTY
jgi:hypothetical protein